MADTKLLCNSHRLVPIQASLLCDFSSFFLIFATREGGAGGDRGERAEPKAPTKRAKIPRWRLWWLSKGMKSFATSASGGHQGLARSFACYCFVGTLSVDCGLYSQFLIRAVSRKYLKIWFRFTSEIWVEKENFCNEIGSKVVISHFLSSESDQSVSPK